MKNYKELIETELESLNGFADELVSSAAQVKSLVESMDDDQWSWLIDWAEYNNLTQDNKHDVEEWRDFHEWAESYVTTDRSDLEEAFGLKEEWECSDLCTDYGDISSVERHIGESNKFLSEMVQIAEDMGKTIRSSINDSNVKDMYPENTGDFDDIVKFFKLVDSDLLDNLERDNRDNVVDALKQVASSFGSLLSELRVSGISLTDSSTPSNGVNTNGDAAQADTNNAEHRSA